MTSDNVEKTGSRSRRHSWRLLHRKERVVWSSLKSDGGHRGGKHLCLPFRKIDWPKHRSWEIPLMQEGEQGFEIVGPPMTNSVKKSISRGVKIVCPFLVFLKRPSETGFPNILMSSRDQILLPVFSEKFITTSRRPVIRLSSERPSTRSSGL